MERVYELMVFWTKYQHRRYELESPPAPVMRLYITANSGKFNNPIILSNVHRLLSNAVDRVHEKRYCNCEPMVQEDEFASPSVAMMSEFDNPTIIHVYMYVCMFISIP